MDTRIPPEADEPPMIREDELERLLAIEVACECLLVHSEWRELLAADAAAERRAA
jgi:hypothetical protein